MPRTELTHPDSLKKYREWIVQHQFTPTEFDDFRSCPNRFFVQSVLKIKADPIPDIELTPLEIGILIHKILERFMRHSGQRLYETGLSPELKAQMENEMEQLLKKEILQRPQLSRPLLRRQQKLIARSLQSFLEQEQSCIDTRPRLRPRYFEWAFGKGQQPLSLKLAHREWKIAGRIDRIDVDETNKRFLIIDYKTGSTRTTGGQILRGESFQLPLYILAVKQLLLPDYEPIGGVYYHLSDMSKKDGLLHAERLPEGFVVSSRSSSLIRENQWDAAFQKILENLDCLAEKISAGDFTASQEPCRTDCPLWFYCEGGGSTNL